MTKLIGEKFLPVYTQLLLVAVMFIGIATGVSLFVTETPPSEIHKNLATLLGVLAVASAVVLGSDIACRRQAAKQDQAEA